MNGSEQIVLVTGASAGIGAEFALQFHARSATVVLVARREERLREIVDKLNQIRKDSAFSLVADLAKEEGVKIVEEYIRNHHIEVLVNNAGFGSYGHFENCPLEKELQMVALNINATVRLAHAVIPQLKARRAGALISVSSVAGFQPLPYMATYAGTKAFNYSHSLALHYELKDFGVKVLTVCPGPTATEFQGVSRMPGKLTGRPRDSAAEVVAQSIRALDAGKVWLVPCLKARLLSLPSRILPTSLCTWVIGKVLKSSLP